MYAVQVEKISSSQKILVVELRFGLRELKTGCNMSIVNEKSCDYENSDSIALILVLLKRTQFLLIQNFTRNDFSHNQI